MVPAEASQRLLDGNQPYAANMPNQRDFSTGRSARVQGQYPIAAILSCADSRVAPELAFDQGPGDLFEAWQLRVPAQATATAGCEPMTRP